MYIMLKKVYYDKLIGSSVSSNVNEQLVTSMEYHKYNNTLPAHLVARKLLVWSIRRRV
jgi:hypothetical protein